MKLITEKQTKEIAELESRLIGFYNTFASYPAFSQPSNYPALWNEVLSLSNQLSAQRGSCKILEIGAGRSGFGECLRKSSPTKGIHLTSQDITATNADFLRATSDVVFTENIDLLQGSWDIIFHSYAYEHLCRPQAFNEMIWSHLSSGGYLLIQCPRYDFPLYFPPCFSHLSFSTKLGYALRMAVADLKSKASGEPHFTIFSDPAVFHLPFSRDRDAVHRVRRSDICQLFLNRAEISDFPLPSSGLKDWLVKRFLTLRVILRKEA